MVPDFIGDLFLDIDYDFYIEWFILILMVMVGIVCALEGLRYLGLKHFAESVGGTFDDEDSNFPGHLRNFITTTPGDEQRISRVVYKDFGDYQVHVFEIGFRTFFVRNAKSNGTTRSVLAITHPDLNVSPFFVRTQYKYDKPIPVKPKSNDLIQGAKGALEDMGVSSPALSLFGNTEKDIIEVQLKNFDAFNRNYWIRTSYPEQLESILTPEVQALIASMPHSTWEVCGQTLMIASWKRPWILGKTKLSIKNGLKFVELTKKNRT